MRWSLSAPQISASRPRAVTEYSLAGSAVIFRYKRNANAAVSKAGPRFAEVAGRVISTRFLAFFAGRFAAGIRYFPPVRAQQERRRRWRQERLGRADKKAMPKPRYRPCRPQTARHDEILG